MSGTHANSVNEQGMSFFIVVIAIELLLLAVQFVFGIWMNLFAPFPTARVAFQPYAMMTVMISVPELMIHMMNGVLIGLLSLMIFVLAIMRADFRSAAISAVASLSILLAGISGLLFLFSGFQDNVFSFAMSIGFIVAVISYFFLVYSAAILPRGKASI
ncbi:hypothetical protein [Cuniculiplasma divulgatum]|uniref:Multipass membrane protein n=1 Tax=Cuniculiplasma divulgatum TaxID=1673428 RepID=A0A1N5WFD7_9ARCH|nr:hypothetical protein [Cuniculiplasma divulgatum]SIM83931.1 multipass membrane protein [Cuniculiplasma divulgatum]